jgi:hypothetical protein
MLQLQGHKSNSQNCTFCGECCFKAEAGAEIQQHP